VGTCWHTAALLLDICISVVIAVFVSKLHGAVLVAVWRQMKQHVSEHVINVKLQQHLFYSVISVYILHDLLVLLLCSAC
jgi:hypothetical protein